MGKKTFIITLVTVSFFLVAHLFLIAQNSQALTMEYIDGGKIEAITGRYYLNDPESPFTHITHVTTEWNGATADHLEVYENGAYASADAYGHKLTGTLGDDHAHFHIFSSSRAIGTEEMLEGGGIRSYSKISSYNDATDHNMIGFTFKSSEADKDNNLTGVELTAKSTIKGSADSSGPTAPAHVYFKFGVCTDPVNRILLTDSTPEATPIFFEFNELDVPAYVDTGFLPVDFNENLGTLMNNTNLGDGDSVWVEFQQYCWSEARFPDDDSQIFTCNSDSDIISVAIEAEAIPNLNINNVPEPATFFLLGICLLGFGLLDKRKKILHK